MPKIKVLFKMFYLYHKAAYDPLIEVFESDPWFDVYLSLTHEMTRRFYIFEVNRAKKYLKKFQKMGHQIAEESDEFDIVICPDTVDDAIFGKTMLCFVNHGTGIKNILYRKLKSQPDTHYLFFVEGQYRVDALMQSGALQKSEVFKVGLPKLDPLFQKGYYNRDELLQSLGLDPAKKTALFAPTYKPTCVYDVKNAIFEATTDYNLIIKLHHYAWMGKFARHSQHYVIQQRLMKYDHATLIPKDDYNIIPFMSVADTLVSEASSTVFDFLATGKTGVIYDLPHEDLTHDDGEPLLNIDNRKFLQESFVHVNAPEQLSDGIIRALNPTEKMQRSAQKERDYYFTGLDGRASKRIRDTILQLYEEGNHFNIPGSQE